MSDRSLGSMLITVAVTAGLLVGITPARASAAAGYFETHTQTVDPGRSLEAVSCIPGSSTCVVDDDAGNLFYANAVSATEPADWTPWAGPGHSPGGAISCPTSSYCAVTAGEVEGGGGNLYYASSPGGSLATALLPSHGVNDVSCASASFCVSAQQRNYINWSTSPAGIKWHSVEIGSGTMTGASCLSASFCAVVDDSGNVRVATTEAGVKEAGGWTASEVDGPCSEGGCMPPPEGEGTPLRGISCISTTACLAVDGTGGVLRLAISSGGGASAARTTVAGASDLDAVSCVGSTCAASGVEGSVFASTDAGATWTERYGGGARIDDVSCASATLCAAVSADGAVITLDPATSVGPLRVLTGALPGGVAGSPYGATNEAEGGEPPYEWSATGLPPGLTIDPTSGQISGTPLTAVCAIGPCPQPPDVLSITVIVTDLNGTEASRPLTLSLGGTRDPIKVSIAGTGSGEVTSDPSGIACTGSQQNCEASFEYGTPVALTAKASPGSTFEGWFGDGCSGTGTCQVTWDPKVTFVVARFAPIPARTTPPIEPSPPAPGSPGTRISGAKITRSGIAVFRFGAVGEATSFRCTLSGPGHRHATYEPCTSPRTYRHLRPGRYKFAVRGSGPGGTDQSPATRTFRIRS